MSEIRLIVFDLTGTTVVDDKVVARSLHQAARESNLDVSMEELQQYTGTNKMHLYQFMLARKHEKQLSLSDFEGYDFSEKHEEARKIFSRYSELVINHYRKHARAIPGAEETFRWCHEHGIKVATVTGFHRDINNAIIEGLKWKERNLIDLAVDVETTNGAGPPAPFRIFYAMEKLDIQSEQEVVNVGDTPADLLAGFHADVRGNIGVLTGSNLKKTLRQYNPTNIIRSVRDLPSLLEKEFTTTNPTFPE
ncbi:MAG: HAD hydrolase-like protein [Bacteroidales bacterium]|nr:HAD hydrolase-like protein [Bacteroidales bacterium]